MITVISLIFKTSFQGQECSQEIKDRKTIDFSFNIFSCYIDAQ